jgi:hypothetical protein
MIRSFTFRQTTLSSGTRQWHDPVAFRNLLTCTARRGSSYRNEKYQIRAWSRIEQVIITEIELYREKLFTGIEIRLILWIDQSAPELVWYIIHLFQVSYRLMNVRVKIRRV